MNMPDKYPASAILYPAEYKAWRSKYHPDTPRPKQGRHVIICPPKAETILGIGRTIRCAYYGGRYFIEAQA